jgi:hypothetical protein
LLSSPVTGVGLLIILNRSFNDIRAKGSPEFERDERFEVGERASGETGRRSASFALNRPGVGGSGRMGRGAIAGRSKLLSGTGLLAAGDAGIVYKVEVIFECPLLEKLLKLLLGACE